jgi:cell fate (sporulation/competence/biofilm development) regulator YmcA (YheA/YmcA/DUF963 family)
LTTVRVGMSDKELEAYWAAEDRKRARARRVQKLCEWKAYHRQAAYSARLNGESVARQHDEKVAQIEEQITRLTIGTSDVA